MSIGEPCWRMTDRDVACWWPCSHPGDLCACCTPPTFTSTATATETPDRKPRIASVASASSSASSIARLLTRSISCSSPAISSITTACPTRPWPSYEGSSLAFVSPLVILPGNHDCLRANAIYDRHDFTTGTGHVHVIRRLNGETIEFPELDAVVWGRAMEEHEPAFQPLAHIPARDDRRWCLAMAHGFFYETRQQPERSSPIFGDEIRDTGWDYIALGHHHARTGVSQGPVTAHYAGAPVLEGHDENPEVVILQIDLSVEDGIRVTPQRLR
jgi:Calcineurin-like phosphoesterase